MTPNQPAMGLRAFGRRVATGSKWGFVVAAAFCVALGFQVATQKLASQFEHQEVLGPRVHRIYPPWAIAQWSTRWQSQYPDEFAQARKTGMVGAFLGLFVVVCVMTLRISRLDLHGSARWASEAEIRASGLLPRRRTLWQWLRRKRLKAGVIVGQWVDGRGRKRLLVDRSDGHVLGMAPTRSGKGVG